MHRDLKPENVLLNEKGHIKLTDFGTSKVVGLAKDARSNSFVGTAEYIGPELLQGDNKVAYKSMDLWSLGCMVFQMICGRPPFRGATEYVTFQKVSAGKLVYPTNMPLIAKDLINKLCVMDPFARLGANDFADLKAHPFFAKINWNTILESTPVQTPFPDKLMWEEDVLREEEERQRQVREAERKEWASFLLDTENILVSGLIYKRRKLSIKKRFMILTDTPRLIYIDPKVKELKGEVPWSRKLTVEVKNDVVWRVNTVRSYCPLGRSLHFFDIPLSHLISTHNTDLVPPHSSFPMYPSPNVFTTWKTFPRTASAGQMPSKSFKTLESEFSPVNYL